MSPLEVEKKVRDKLNKLIGTTAKKEILSLSEGGPSHEFDIFEEGKIIGGVSTSPWFNNPNAKGKQTGNTSGQDRAATEILWLTLWQGPERRLHILTDKEMADRIFKKFNGAVFPNNVEIQHFDLGSGSFNHVGTL
ncbi:hypothetical protein ACJJIW_20830 [Microbulbifer sp. JMSA004]|uniref:hypothetical protein n=1 Tax=unclassified Microbulbifer TaxID=2619833 RepID=UPI00403AAB81